MAEGRIYDIAILGATGWTATICAEHITRTFPTTIKWCIAGRSEAKLEALRETLKTISSDRLQPNIYVIPHLDEAGLEPLILRSKVVINGIGPYHRYGTPVVAACAKNGTHYVDFSTETAWIIDMVKSYNHVAQESEAIIIPAISGSSSASDLSAWLIATYAKEQGLSNLNDIICSGKLNMVGMQGTSLHTVLDVAENYGISGWLKGDTWGMSSQPTPARASERTLFGYKKDVVLGKLGFSFTASGNESVVHRSAGLDSEMYGGNFVFREYVPVDSFFSAAMLYLVTKLGTLLLAIPWFRSFVRGKSFEPGTGPDRDVSREGESLEWRAVGYVSNDPKPVVSSRFVYKGALVDIAAILGAEAAASIIDLTEGTYDLTPRSGLLTPSRLGMTFVERLRTVGVDVEVECL